MTNREKYLSQVKGINQERDFSIIELKALNPDITQAEIIKILNLDITQPHISQILTNNKALYYEVFMRENPLASKEGRIEELAKLYNRKKDKGTKKDIADLIEQIRKEQDDKSVILDQSVNHYVQFYRPEPYKKSDMETTRWATDRSV